VQIYRARKHQMVLTNWAPDYFDPHSNADTFAHNDDDSDTPKIKPLAWRNHWYIPELTKETLAAAREIDVEKRKAQYAALQKKVTDEGPFVIMFQNANQVAPRADVKGFKTGLRHLISSAAHPDRSGARDRRRQSILLQFKRCGVRLVGG
jgi:peptide/nickel transport system substrate-binding protein